MNKIFGNKLILSIAVVSLLVVVAGAGTALGRSIVSTPETPVVTPLQVGGGEFPMAFQGVLTSVQGVPVTDGFHQITFAMYNDDTAGTLLWQESQSVKTAEGLFDVLLGSRTAIDPSVAADNSEMYLGVKVGSDAELKPRIRLAYSPYAYHSLSSEDSNTLDGLDSSDFALRGQTQSGGGGSVSIGSLFAPFTSVVVDNNQDVGLYSAVAIGVDGFPIISYQDAKERELKVAHCSDVNCSSATISTVDDSGTVGLYTSIAIGADGFPIISYFHDSDETLNIAHCENVLCTRAEINDLDRGGVIGLYTSIAIGDDGLAIISYFDEDESDLKVAQCDDEECSDADLATVDETGDLGKFTSIAVGSDGLPIVSYFDEDNNALKVAHCSDDECNSATITTVDDLGNVGEYTSIAIGADGFAIISYYDTSNDNLKVAHCSNINCSSSTESIVDSIGNVGLHTSITVGVDGLAVITYYDDTHDDLKVAHCSNASCTSTDSIMTVDRPGNVGLYTSVTTGADGLPVVSYFNETTGELKVLHCAKVGCAIP